MENLNLSKCLCGKKPMAYFEKNGRFTIKCDCGIYVPMVATVNDAVKAWERFIEKNNNPEDILRIYGYEDDEPKKKKKRNKKSPKKKSKEETVNEEETEEFDDEE